MLTLQRRATPPKPVTPWHASLLYLVCCDRFAAPHHDFSPIQILDQYIPKTFDFNPGSRQDYSSANYILLGLVLANHLSVGAGDWRHYDQHSVFPDGSMYSEIIAHQPFTLWAGILGQCLWIEDHAATTPLCMGLWHLHTMTQMKSTTEMCGMSVVSVVGRQETTLAL